MDFLFNLSTSVLNCVSISSALWLLFLGEWRIVLAGVLGAFVAKYVIGYAEMIGSALLGAPAMTFFEKKKPLVVAALLFIFLYSYLIIYLWCTFKVSTKVLFFTLFWSYGVAIFLFFPEIAQSNTDILALFHKLDNLHCRINASKKKLDL